MIWFLTVIINFLAVFISWWPRRLQLFIGACLGYLWFYVVRIRRKLVLEHIRKAFPEKSEKEIKTIARKNFVNYGNSFIEFLQQPVMNQKLFNKMAYTEGFENYASALAQKKGVFILSLHLGNWEFMSTNASLMGIDIHVLTKKLKAGGLNEVWTKIRVAQGLKLIAAEKTTFDILRVIKKGGTVGFILDQFMGPPVGVRTKFFGHETGTAASLALFADRTRSPVIPTYNVREKDGRIKTVFEPAVPFVEQGSTEKNISFMTQVYTSRIEDIVKKYPDQWLWLHRRWKPFRE